VAEYTRCEVYKPITSLDVDQNCGVSDTPTWILGCLHGHSRYQQWLSHCCRNTRCDVGLLQMTGVRRAYWWPMTSTYWGWCRTQWVPGRTSCCQVTVRRWRVWLRWLLSELCSLLSAAPPPHSSDDSLSSTPLTCKLRFIKQLFFLQIYKFVGCTFRESMHCTRIFYLHNKPMWLAIRATYCCVCFIAPCCLNIRHAIARQRCVEKLVVT